MHSSKCDERLGWGTHGSSQIHSGLSAGVFAWHDAPKRSAVHEITFIQPSHAWLDYFGCEKKEATKQGLVTRASRVTRSKVRVKTEGDTV